jgi:hypothetical protein
LPPKPTIVNFAHCPRVRHRHCPPGTTAH